MLEKIQISVKFQGFQLRPPVTKKIPLSDVFLGDIDGRSPSQLCTFIGKNLTHKSTRTQHLCLIRGSEREQSVQEEIAVKRRCQV